MFGLKSGEEGLRTAESWAARPTAVRGALGETDPPDPCYTVERYHLSLPMAGSRPTANSKSKNGVLYAAVVLSWIAYVVMTTTAPTVAAQRSYGLFHWQVVALQITIAAAFLVTWLAAFYGARRIAEYQHALEEGEHHRSFRMISAGLHVLAIGLVLTGLVSGARSSLTGEAGSVRALTITLNYLYAFFPLAGFLLLRQGTLWLLPAEVARTLRSIRVEVTVITVLLGAVMTYLVFTDPGRIAPAMPGGQATFYLPDALVLGTVMLPLVVAVAFGTLAVFNLYRYVERTAAVIYEKTLPPFANGVFLVVASTVVLELLLMLGSARLQGLGLAGVLVAVYLFLGIQTTGYLLVARSAGRLAKLQKTLKKFDPELGHKIATL